jgi:hypothetical protein
MTPKITKKIIHWLRVAAIGMVLGLAFQFARAWVEPGVSPPGGNVAAPLHIGTTPQTKQGSLSVLGGTYAEGVSFGVYGKNTTNGSYGLLGYNTGGGAVYGGQFYSPTSWAGVFYGPVYSDSYFYSLSYIQAPAYYDKADSNYGFINRNVYADTINTGYSGDPLELNYYRSGDIRFIGGDLTMANGRYIYPGRTDGGDNQKNWYLASSGSWGLYTNTSMDIAGGLYLSNQGNNYLYNDGTYIKASTFLRAGSGIYSDNWIQSAGSVYVGSHLLEANGSYVYPGRNDGGGSWQGNWYLASNGNWGLYTNTGIYAVGNSAFPKIYDSDNTNSGFYVDPNSTTVLNVVYANQYNCMSDINLKKDIRPIGDALNKILSIKGVNFTWKDADMGAGNQVGVIAQDVEKILPEVVTTNEQGLKAVDYSKLTPLIIESVKDLKIEKDRDVNILREKIDNLEASEKAKDEMINDLRRRLDILESK